MNDQTPKPKPTTPDNPKASAELRSTDLVGGWILTSEKLPSPETMVLVCYGSGIIEVASLENYECPLDGSNEPEWRTYSESISSVHHWMPLPKPPNCDSQTPSLISKPASE